mgnify:CR=1 FL=1
MGNIPAQFIKDFSSGQVNNLNENLKPESSVRLAMNVDADEEIGSLVSRLGSSVVNVQLVDNNVILGLHDFNYGTTSNKLLAVINNAGDTQSVVYDVEAGTNPTGWTTLTANTKARFVTFLDSVLLINGVDAESSYNGTTVITTGGAFDLANIPSSNTVDIGIEWRDRVYLAGDTTEPSRLYYSSTPYNQAITWDSDGTATFTAATTDIITSSAHGLSNEQLLIFTTSGTLPAGLSTGTPYYVISIDANTFNVSTKVGGSAVDITDTGTGTHTWHTWQFTDIEPEDGTGPITGLGKVPGYLLIFKERNMKRWNFDNAFPETLMNIGTPSHESIINAAGLCAFYSASNQSNKGFYITNGGRPVPISHMRARNIKKWVDAIPQSFDANVSGWGTENYFLWSIGDVTVDGIDYTNVVVKWNRIFDQWTVRSYPSEFRVFSSYLTTAGNNTIVVGDDDGNVIQIDVPAVYTDYPSTTRINWEVILQQEDFGFNQIKEISDRIVVRNEGIEDAVFRVTLDNDPLDKVVNVGTVDKRVKELKLTQTLRANDFQISLKGSQIGRRAYLKEIEIPSINVLPENYG